MEALDSFVAGALLQRVRRANDNERAAASASFRGAALFVDISGYSTLAESLCDRGPRGIEDLGRALDSAFRSYVRTVRDLAGEIACFAGDAFLAYWAADDDDVADALRRARACARRLHAASRSGSSSLPTLTPRLHIGLGAGDLWAARLGAEDGWQLLLGGAAVRDACAASARAAAGETAVAADADSFGTSDDNPNATSSTDASSTPGSPDAFDVTSHVPRHIQEYVGEGYSAWIPERRTICALFTRIDGLDERVPDALSRHQAAVTSIHVALRPYAGSSGTLARDDKGLVFTLCLGMPHDAHADDALRAVRAGLAIRGELTRLGLDCAIGVAAGLGVCMPLGGPERQHYWSVGRFMHVAGRLMQAAGSGMLCTEEVADQVRRAATLSPERSLTLTGRRLPQRVFRVREAAGFDDHPERLYGREDEQATLDRCLDEFEHHRGTVLWMIGDAGIGKTALVRYLRQAAAARGITCLVGGAGSVEIAAAYAAWRSVFAALLRNPESADAPSAAERHALLADISHPQLAPLVNAVAPGFLDESPLVQNLSGQARADATVSVLSELIARRATTRFVLVLEDCHWMDSASWRLVLRVAQDCPHALILLTSRPEAASEELGALKRLEHFARLDLTPLRSGAIKSLVEHALDERSGDGALVDEIVEHSLGNPLFAREYALLLATRPAAREAGPGRLASTRPGGSEALPVTVQSLIASRLDSLPSHEALALKAASVIGDRFRSVIVAGVYPGSQQGPALEDLLTNLVERQLVVREETADLTFAFSHALIREVVYQELTGDQRRDLHQRVAQTLEREYQSDLRPHVAALAHHWSHAGAAGSAMKYADQAASQALAAGAFEEADRLLGTCIAFAREAGQQVSAAGQIRWHRQVADARSGMGQLEARSAAARDALRLAGLSRAHTPIGLVAQATTRLARAMLRRLLLGHPHIGDVTTALDVARAYRHSAEVCYFNNDMLGMICDDVSAVAVASTLKPSAVLAGAATELGGILSVAGLRRTGERILHRAIATAEAADDQAAQAYAHMISCLYYVGVGDWRSAERSARRCQALCEPLDDRVNWTNAQAVRFWMSHYRSHDAAAYDAACSLRDRASETGNRQHHAWAFRFLALCALRRGEPRDATSQLQGALDCLGETAALNERIPTLGILALAHLRNGQVWAARATANEGLALVLRVRRPIGHSTLEGYSSLVTVALDAWREERSPHWRRAIETCLRILGRYRKSFPVGEPRYQLHRGDFRRLSGALGGARRSYRRGEAAASRLGMPWDERRCREALDAMSLTPDHP
jgi:hypothetical protein